jgi:hypothetical protein
LFALTYQEANFFIEELMKAHATREKETLIKMFSHVMWSRVEPKDIPKIEDIIAPYEQATATSTDTPKATQSPSEQDEALRTIANRFKRR